MSGKGFTQGLTGRADLVRARQLGDSELEEYLAGLLGYQLKPKEPPPKLKTEEIEQTVPTEELPKPSEPVSAAVTQGIPFWRAESYKCFPSEEGVITPPRVAKPRLQRPLVDLSFMPLTSTSSLLTRLRAASGTRSISGEIDVDRIVDAWGRGRFLSEMPRSSRKVWGRSIQVWIDRSRRLIPYWEDQSLACKAIGQIYPPDGYSRVVLTEGCFEPSIMRVGDQYVDYQPPSPGSTLVAFSDLGVLATNGSELIDRWAERGRRLRELELNPLAVVPFRRSACPEELSRYWTILPWETSADGDAPALDAKQTEEIVRQILTLLSFTLRIEPQLIRFVRRLIEGGRGEPGIESLVWQHPAFDDPHSQAAELSRDWALKLRSDHSQQDAELRRRIYEWVEDAHSVKYKGVWYAELGNLGLDPLIEDQRGEMLAWFKQQPEALQSEPSPNPEGLTAWHQEVTERLLDVAYQDRDGLGQVLHTIWDIVHGDNPLAELPSGTDLRKMPTGEERTFELRQQGKHLVVTQHSSEGSLLALIRSRQRRIKVETIHFPPWADDWGRDEFGEWATLLVKDVTQRLRWIPPGEFWMGSPEDERWGGDWPRHRESITKGFWIFDTPCTQALWEAVMGDNPSKFKWKDHPVDSVRRDQCQEFLRRLNAQYAGLELGLPSEAQWEYACRAKTETTRYRENLDEIAWYSANSNRTTHPVSQKTPNDFGLFDTLGNVWERCDDVWTTYFEGTRKISKLSAASPQRVFRGGSWRIDASYVRAAFRLDFEPEDWSDDLGFRCAEFRAPGPLGPAAWINVDAEGGKSEASPILKSVRVTSDLEEIVLRAMPRPEWATNFGRDQFGLWAEFTVQPIVEKAAPVRQRLRWIPPGRFMMGSPEDEPGRWHEDQLPHEVVIGQGFWMFDTPCTQALWEAAMAKNPSRFEGKPDHPVERVSWNDCQEFVRALNTRLGGNEFVLPSEAQWEYACRAGTEGARYSEDLDAIAWYSQNCGGQTHPVGQKEANPWGLYDMLGNVWEWCYDAWVDASNGSRGSSGPYRVIRGGGWSNSAESCRAAYRNWLGPSLTGSDLGLRVARVPSRSQVKEQLPGVESSEAGKTRSVRPG